MLKGVLKSEIFTVLNAQRCKAILEYLDNKKDKNKKRIKTHVEDPQIRQYKTNNLFPQ